MIVDILYGIVFACLVIWVICLIVVVVELFKFFKSL